jgi:predicted Zn-dependent protease
LRADLLVRPGQWRLAVSDYRSSLTRAPKSDRAANNLAWCLASVSGRGDADEAVRWARKAVDLVPGEPSFRNTLGAALYRAGSFAEAAVELEQNIGKNAPSSGYDWAFLAMCEARLGHKQRARFALARAERWRLVSNLPDPVQAAEFQSILQEACAVVGGTLPDLPRSVFDR